MESYKNWHTNNAGLLLVTLLIYESTVCCLEHVSSDTQSHKHKYKHIYYMNIHAYISKYMYRRRWSNIETQHLWGIYT